MTSPTTAARPRGLVVGIGFVMILLVAVFAAECTSDDADTASNAGQASTGDQTGSTGDDGSAAETTATTAAPTTTTAPPELPGGGRTIFPGRRVVGFYGNSQSEALGVLGETSPEDAVPRLAEATAPFATPDRPALGAFELIVSVAQTSPGADGDYSEPSPPDQIQKWIDVAKANDLLVVLDVQPGRASFVDEVKRYEEFLKDPNVGLGLDPEWRMGPNEKPGDNIGQVDSAEVVEVAEWLSAIVTENDLPQKLFVVHQFTNDMIGNRAALAREFPGLATVIHIDGFGGREVKTKKYTQLAVQAPLYNGFKLFYDEDTDMFDPAGAMALSPTPDLITYQ